MKTPSVIDRPYHDRNIAAEPEMMELKRMIRSGELSADRTAEYLKGQDHEQADAEDKTELQTTDGPHS